MSEYDLVCDVCGRVLLPSEGMVSWSDDGTSERAHALTHQACTPRATHRAEVRLLIAPQGLLSFALERINRRVEDPEAFRSLIWALVPFVVRPDSGAEMQAMRAATFGAVPGFKPIEIRRVSSTRPGGTPLAPDPHETAEHDQHADTSGSGTEAVPQPHADDRPAAAKDIHLKTG
jgi:hypothetical protein